MLSFKSFFLNLTRYLIIRELETEKEIAMFIFKKDQKVIEIDGIKIGGQPGENPTVLVGGLLFKGQPIVKDPREGVFDKNIAEEWLTLFEKMIDLTGHPGIVQIFGATPKAMERHLAWLSEKWDGPFIFESTAKDTRISGMNYLKEVGLIKKAIFNSINIGVEDDELELIKNNQIQAGIALGWSPKARDLSQRMDVINQMVECAENAGIEKIIVDSATLPVGAGYGLDWRTLVAIKARLGLPTCCAAHNAAVAWPWLKKTIKRENLFPRTAVFAAAITATQLLGCDMLMFGSIARSEEMFTAVALIQNGIVVAAAEASRVSGIDREFFSPKTVD